MSSGEPDPTTLVAIAGVLDATTLPVTHGQGWRDGTERFVTLQGARYGEVFR
jgi:hypothetical protein